MNSKKHKENEAKVASKESRADTKAQNEEQAKPTIASSSKVQPQAQPAQSKASAALTVDADATEDEVLQTIDQKIAAARSKLSPNHCLFCTQVSGSLDDNLNHMSNTHSFFIPDAEYLVDIVGLITYLGEKIAIGNVCIYCNTKSREFRTIEAVRKHMIDKSHCKIAYDHEKDRLEISDYYDFSSSYPDHESRKKRRGKRIARPPAAIDETGGWEDVDDEGDSDGEVDEIVDEDGSDVPESDNESDSDSDESLPTQELTYGDTPYELVLPSGARIGHRSLRKYYAQSFKYTPTSNSDPNSGTAIVRRLLADKNSTLVPTKGGFGAFGSGTEVVKARNRGEAREAGRHVREFRDQRRREEFKTKVGFVHNHQKHYRDPLLQVRLITSTPPQIVTKSDLGIK